MVHQRERLAAICATCVVFVLVNVYLPLYELRRSRSIFSKVETVSTKERLYYEITHSHQTYFFGLFFTRLILARLLTWVAMSVGKWALPIVSQLFEWVLSSTHSLVKKLSHKEIGLFLVPSVSSGTSSNKRKKKKEIPKLSPWKTRQRKARLDKAAKEIKKVIREKVFFSIHE